MLWKCTREISATSVSDDERQPPEAPCEKDDDDESLSNPSNLDSSSDEEEELEWGYSIFVESLNGQWSRVVDLGTLRGGELNMHTFSSCPSFSSSPPSDPPTRPPSMQHGEPSPDGDTA